MLKQEAQWIGGLLGSSADDSLFPLLNVGSHTDQFRTKEQPWIDRYVFRPIRERGGRVIHTDLRDAPGVEITGDLTDEHFRNRLRQLGIRSVLCCNLLEHVPEPKVIADSLSDLVAPGGYAVLSVPRRFPYHADPIDTMFRPSPEALAALFPKLDVVDAAVVRCGTWLTYLGGRLLASPRVVVAQVLARHHDAPTVAPPPDAESLWSWSFKRFDVTCVALRRAPA